MLAAGETGLGGVDGDVAGERFGVTPFDHLDVAGADFASGGFGGDIFAEVIEAYAAALLTKFAAGGQSFGESFAGDEAAREAVLHAAARNGIGDAALGGEPKDKIADQHERSWNPRPEHKVGANGRQIGSATASKIGSLRYV